MIRQILQSSWTFFERLFHRLLEFISYLLGIMFQALFDFLKFLLRPVFVVIALVLYLVYKIAMIAWLLIQVFFIIGKIIVAIVKGIFVTLAGFTYVARSPDDGVWSPIIRNVAQGLDYFQIDIIAYVLLFLIWFGVAWGVIRIIGSIQMGD
ncbi:hypothetical protein [Paenibacillus kribbensis]|uniref:hypothetical protein n=1 Tax=Paenibacillus kribbensis TaxID=172713 RepID=UPI00083814A3|nr:hypothetical protein [Paenibacillus kribbensis]